jgi:hypothetical protein
MLVRCCDIELQYDYLGISVDETNAFDTANIGDL